MLEEAVIARGLGLWASAASANSLELTSRMQSASNTHGLSPSGFNGFCLGSVGSNGFASGAGVGEEPPHHDEIWSTLR